MPAYPHWLLVALLLWASLAAHGQDEAPDAAAGAGTAATNSSAPAPPPLPAATTAAGARCFTPTTTRWEAHLPTLVAAEVRMLPVLTPARDQDTLSSSPSAPTSSQPSSARTAPAPAAHRPAFASHDAVVLAGLNNMVTVLDARSGHELPGWPLKLAVSFLAAPLLLPAAGGPGGQPGLLLASVQGDVVAVHANGSLRSDWPALLPPVSLDNGRIAIERASAASAFPAAASVAPADPTARRRLLRSLSREQWLRDRLLDAHVLASPAMVLSPHGRPELVIVPVSYYLDLSEYAGPEFADLLGELRSASTRAATGVCAFAVGTGSLAWATMLDAPSDAATSGGLRAAELLAPVTVADIDGDGLPDIIQASSSGRLFVLDSATGAIKQTLQTRPMHVQPAVQDLDGNGLADVVLCDQHGRVQRLDFDPPAAALHSVWEADLGGPTAAAASVRFVRLNPSAAGGEARVTVLAAGVDGHLWALDGLTGRPLSGWPLYLDQPLVAAPTVLAFPRAPQASQLFVPGSNGTLWLVHLHERCAQRIEVGHELATAVAIGDFTEQKTLEVLAAGFDGAISVLSIGLEPDARMAWPGSAAPVPPFISPLHASHSVLVDGILQGNALVRKIPTVDAPYFELTFHIEAHDQASAPEFHVLILMESEALYSGDFVAGRHTLRLRSPEVCVDARLLLVATDDRGQHQFDSLVVHFHGQSSLVLPWMYLLPFVCTLMLVLVARESIPVLPLRLDSH